MPLISILKFAPAEWLPVQDREVLNRVVNVDVFKFVQSCLWSPTHVADQEGSGLDLRRTGSIPRVQGDGG